MGSSMGAINTAAVLREASTPGVRRSRFSFHFSTLRTRRWLLVQLVSVEESNPEITRAVFRRDTWMRTAQPAHERMIDDFRSRKLFEHCA